MDPSDAPDATLKFVLQKVRDCSKYLYLLVITMLVTLESTSVVLSQMTKSKASSTLKIY